MVQFGSLWFIVVQTSVEPNKFLVRFFVSYHLHIYRLVSVIHSINAAFGVSQKFVPYRPDYDLVLSTLKENSVYSVASATTQATTYNCDTTEWTNGVYLFTVLGVTSNSNRFCSSYMAYISNSGNPAFTAVAETAGSKIIDFTRTSSNRVFTITCDTNAYHSITARRI